MFITAASLVDFLVDFHERFLRKIFMKEKDNNLMLIAIELSLNSVKNNRKHFLNKFSFVKFFSLNFQKLSTILMGMPEIVNSNEGCQYTSDNMMQKENNLSGGLMLKDTTLNGLTVGCVVDSQMQAVFGLDNGDCYTNIINISQQKCYF